MSCSKWAWQPGCDYEYCPGDCDDCPKAWNMLMFMEEDDDE